MNEVFPGVRRGESDDLPAIAKLLEAVGLPTEDLPSARNLQTWVFEAGGVLLAAIGLERFGNEALLRSLVVVPESRKVGVGRGLITRLEHEARADGITRLILLTETAEAYFRARGYVVTDRRAVSDAVRQSAEFRSLCPVSAVCLSKAL